MTDYQVGDEFPIPENNTAAPLPEKPKERPQDKAPPPLPDYTWKKRVLLLIPLLLFFGEGVLTQYMGERWEYLAGINGISSLIFLFILVYWCRYDSLERGKRLDQNWMVGLILLALIAFPAYLFKSRGALRGFGALFWTLLYCVGLGIANELGMEVVAILRP